MKTKKILAGLCAALLLAALPGCGKKITEAPPPAVSDPAKPAEPAKPAAPAKPDDAYIGLTEADAQALAIERLPEGMTIKLVGTIDREGNILADPRAGDKEFYYAWDVHDAAGARVGGVAIGSQSGERYNYNGGTGAKVVTDYADFALYDAATDAVCDWNGVFKNGDASVELAQSDNNSFDFAFSLGGEGTARIKGNTAATGDGALTFTFVDANTLRVGGTNAALAGTYTK